MDKEFYEAIIELQQKTIEKLSETNQSLMRYLTINANQSESVKGMTLAEYEAKHQQTMCSLIYFH